VKPNPARTRSPILILLTLFVFGGMVLNACTSTQEINAPVDHGRLKVVATTTFVGDVVGKIAGDAVDLFVLLEPGQNPHSYLASPRDMVRISEADIIFANGLGLEDFLDDMADGADIDEKIVVVSEYKDQH
jgi:ABC-type Zn uptake system ZnuABC Zn-binding protein ZnuA